MPIVRLGTLLFSQPRNSSQTYAFVNTGIASLVCALCFVVGFIMIFWIEPGIHLNPTQRLQFILSHGRFFQAWYFVIFVIFGSSLLVLINGLEQWTKREETLTFHFATLVGFIWASYTFSCGLIAIFTIEYLLSLPAHQQSSVWYVIYAIQMGMGDGIEWIGGVWLCIITFQMHRSQKGPRKLHYFGFLVGGIGCLTIIPRLQDAGVVFGLLQIIWFFWIALIMTTLPKPPHVIQMKTE
ncbi:hypothetical protein BK026_05090 [Alteromonas sp. V450]|nr:hypothetical protein BK026_05090 [Alteromonas sp. V450]